MYAKICAALGLARGDVLRHQWADNGPPWQALQLRDAQAVLDVVPDYAAMSPFGVGLVGAHPGGAGIDFEVRGLMGFEELPAEDPATGSLNAALAQWLIGEDVAPASTRSGRERRWGGTPGCMSMPTVRISGWRGRADADHRNRRALSPTRATG